MKPLEVLQLSAGIALVAVPFVLSIWWDLRSKRGQPKPRQFDLRTLVPRSTPGRVIFFTVVFMPVAAVVGAGIAGAAGLRYAWLGALALILATSVVVIVNRVRRIRRIEDLATSRIRSAAQGYVEIQGKAKPISLPTHCQACHTECLWWSVADNQGKVHSGQVPFMVEDETGFCLVDPKGAEWIMPQSRCPSSPRDWQSGGRHLAAGTVVYVLGEFSTDRSGQGPDPARVRAGAQASAVVGQRIQQALATPQGMASADSDRDGKLSLAERQAFAAHVKQQVGAERGLDSWQSEVHRMGRPKDGRAYVIATESQAAALRRLRWHLAFSTVGASAVAATLCWNLVA